MFAVKGSLMKAALADKKFVEKIKDVETETEFRLMLIEWGITHGYKVKVNE